VAELIPIPSPGIPLVFGETGAPVVVVVHDEFGRLPWLTPYAEALASRGGFRVIVPDLYNGVATDDDDQADILLEQLSGTDARAAVIGEIDAAHADGSPRAGIVGFSMGGGLALQVAQAGVDDFFDTAEFGAPEPDHGLRQRGIPRPGRVGNSRRAGPVAVFCQSRG